MRVIFFMKIIRTIFILLFSLLFYYGILELQYYVFLSQINLDTIVLKTNISYFDSMFLNICLLSLLYILIYGATYFLFRRVFERQRGMLYMILAGTIIASIHLLVMYWHGLDFDTATYLSYISLHILTSLLVNLSMNYQKNKVIS